LGYQKVNLSNPAQTVRNKKLILQSCLNGMFLAFFNNDLGNGNSRVLNSFIFYWKNIKIAAA